MVSVKTMSSLPNQGSSLLESISSAAEEGILDFAGYKAKDFMAYKGRFKEVVSTLKEACKCRTSEDAKNLFLFSNRLLIGIIDYALEKKEDLLELKHDAENFNLKVCEGDYKSASEILSAMKFPKSLLSCNVVEKPDSISWNSFNPEFVSNLLDKMEYSGRNFDFFVMDGHDAYRPGFMAASYFKAGACALRNSVDSGRDLKPRPLLGEADYLRDALSGKDVVLFGEDVSTGSALMSLEKCVMRVSKPGRVITASSIFVSGDSKAKPNFFGVEKYSF